MAKRWKTKDKKEEKSKDKPSKDEPKGWKQKRSKLYDRSKKD